MHCPVGLHGSSCHSDNRSQHPIPPICIFSFIVFPFIIKKYCNEHCWNQTQLFDLICCAACHAHIWSNARLGRASCEKLFRVDYNSNNPSRRWNQEKYEFQGFAKKFCPQTVVFLKNCQPVALQALNGAIFPGSQSFSGRTYAFAKGCPNWRALLSPLFRSKLFSHSA